jgi:hypothetical protein
MPQPVHRNQIIDPFLHRIIERIVRSAHDIARTMSLNGSWGGD